MSAKSRPHCGEGNGVGFAITHLPGTDGDVLQTGELWAYGFIACCNSLQSMPEIFPSVVSVQSGVRSW